MRGFFTKLLMLVLCAAIVLSLGACSGDDVTDDGGRDTAPPRASDREPDGTDGESGTPEDTAPAEPPAFLAGQELAAEADPLGKAAENIRAALAAYAEDFETELADGTVLLTDGEARVYGTVYDPLFGEDVAVVRIELAHHLNCYVWIGWRVDTGALAFLHLDIPDGADKDALTATVYSDSVARGIEESMEKCRAARPFEQNWTGTGYEYFNDMIYRTYEVRSAGGMALMTTDSSVRLYWLGGDLRLDGDLLYFLDGGEAVVYGLWYTYFDRTPEEAGDLYIPDTLGGCPVTRVRLSPCDGWESVFPFADDGQWWTVLPPTAQDVAVEFDSGHYIIPDARHLAVMFRPYAKERGGTQLNMTYSHFVCLNRDMEFTVPEDLMSMGKTYTFAYWGSGITEYGEHRDRSMWISYLDTVDGSWEQTEAAIKDRSAVELALLAGAGMKDIQGLTDEDILSAISREDLLAEARSRWEEAVGDPQDVSQAEKDMLENARKGDAGALVKLMKDA